MQSWKTSVIGRYGAELFLWLGLLCELIVSPSGYLFGNYHEPVIIVLGMGCFSLSILLQLIREPDHGRSRWLLIFLAGAYGLACYYAQHSALILRIVLILLAGHRTQPRSVMRFFFYGTLLIVLLGAVLSLLGLHNATSVDELFRHEVERRYTLGFYHPNGLSFFVFRLYAMWLCLYGEKTRLRYAVPIAAGFGALLWLANSKMGLAIYALLTLCAVALRAVRHLRRELPLLLGGIVSYVLILGLLLSLRFYPYPERTVQSIGDPESVWDYANVLTSGRLDHARQALLTTPYTLLGSRSVADGTEIGFVNAFLNQGAIFLLLFLLLYLRLLWQLYRERDGYGLLLALGFFLYALAEAYLPYLNKNGIWLLMLGETLRKGGRDER